MTQTYEISNFNPHTPFKCVIHHIGHIRTHMHHFFEIIFVLSGECKILIEDKLYHLVCDDLIIVESHIPHELRASDCVYASIQLDQTALEDTFPVPMHPKFECNSKLPGKEEAFNEMRKIIAKLIKNNADRQTGYELRNWILIYQLMDVLFIHFRVERTAAVEKRNYRYAARIAEISHIVKEHYKEDLPLSRVADMVHLSAPYLSKFFIEQFGMNYLTYLTQLRMNSAVYDLMYTEKNIEEVSADNGFPNSHAFTQAFKKEYNMMPSVYRRMQKNSTNNDDVPAIEYRDYLAGLGKYLNTETAPAPKMPAVSAFGEFSAAAPQKKLKHTWRTVLSIGKASDILLSDIQTLLRRAKKEIGFQYLFFNGILSDDLYVYHRKNGQSTYNFAYVDRILDFLESIDLCPFLQFSYMPADLAKNPEKMLFNHLVSEPKDFALWCDLIQAFMKHILDRYGINKVLQWKFSVWHQPNTSVKLYGFENDSDFYTFYQATYRTVKNFHPGLCFGLPSMYGYVNEENPDVLLSECHSRILGIPNWHLKMLQWCQLNDCVPDFLNFTYYDIKVTKQKNNSRSTFGFVFMMTLNDDTDGVKSFVSTIKKDLRNQHMEKLPAYICEWNNTPSQQDLLNDTCFKSCYIVKNILENYDQMASFSYWSLTDLMSEAPLPDNMLFGGLGLFTINGLPKASYYAMTLLRQLGDEFLAQGDGWFATKTDTDIRIITYHYVHFSHLYAVGEQFIMTPQNRYTMFSSCRPLKLSLNLTHMENRKYSMKQYLVGRQEGSLFDTWLKIGCADPCTEQDRTLLESKSMPGSFYSEIEAVNGELSVEVNMEPLDVRLIIIK